MAYKVEEEARRHCREYYAKNKKKWADYNKRGGLRFRKKLKFDTLSAYSSGSPHCECCGIEEVAFLCIDHKNGGGNQHRKITGRGMLAYMWLRKNKFPPGFQVLCFNCNNGKQINNGICPHKLIKTED